MHAISRIGLLSLALVPLGSGVPASAAPACTGRPSAVRLFVHVTNVKPGGGLIAVSVYADNSSKFLAKRGALYVGRVPARSPRTDMCIFVPAAGTWALAVYHDANSDRSFNRTGIGLPAEGYGFSNNPSALFGLPAFSSVRLHIGRSNLGTTMRLKYRS